MRRGATCAPLTPNASENAASRGAVGAVGVKGMHVIVENAIEVVIAREAAVELAFAVIVAA